MTGGLLVITAHPDDEVLIAGGTLAACAAAGIDGGVMCLTRGERGPISDPRLATPTTLADVRVKELHAACTELGVRVVKCWRRQDGGLRWSDRSSIVRQLVAALESSRPDAVITFGEDGLYYHPDHVATYELTLRAVQRLADPPSLYRSVWPKALMRELGSELRKRGLSDELWELHPEDFGTEDLGGGFAIDVRQFVNKKLRALRARKTQISDAHAFAALDFALADRFLGTEWFAPVLGSADWLLKAAAHG